MRAALVVLLLASTTAVATADKDKDDKPAKADTKKADAKKVDPKKTDKPELLPPEPRKPGPDDAKATAILDKLVAAPDVAARRAATDELTKIAPTAVDAIGEWVQRPHQTTQADRKKVLAAIKAAVPDKDGKFNTPQRTTAAERKADDELDWQKALLELDPTMVGVGEVIADVAAIRALAATKSVHGADVLFGIAFGLDTIIYRDEVGRFIRKMEPYCIPGLTRDGQLHKSDDRRRYATWQLERIDRQDPLKAMAAAAGDESLMIAVIEVYRETKIREAVHAVWLKVNDDSPRIRATARAAWMDYITGPAPALAPRKRLMLAGGKLTKFPKPMWLNYRELADNELRLAANSLLNEEYPVQDETSFDDKPLATKVEKIDLSEVTKRLFEYYDGERTKLDAAQWTAAKTKADGGDLAGAIVMLDRLIITNPERAERSDMAKVYAEWAKQLEGKQQWGDASAAYSKSHGLDPKSPAAVERLAAHHYALGKALEAQGKDGGPDFRRAVALKPDYAPAQTAADRSSLSSKRPTWMLFAAVGAAIAAMVLFGLAMLRRRAA